ncbi:hypothetical protein [Thiomicrorhabdus xiamenensis]|uniref:Trypsin-like peptidase domain-containing protein n=1 Tax=Thiomicrorhabdus xiamenensis TaxID=2739063 RepID=A0A7D4T258_9GAMM|nr:hypothetical protein [Thiomicrorhabdus xiamenensis]QKI90125.1 hypothetical protein HQN79_11345 [Thiomicrorhabdus xiamenensis]
MFANDPKDAVVPIFAKEKYSGKIQQIGTGIFIDFQGKPFLYTAAHVTDNSHSGELMIPTRFGIEPIDGYMAYIDLPPEVKRQDDAIDIAYYRLSTNFASSMMIHFKPFPQSRIKLIKSSLESGVCSVYGYPISKGKKRKGKYESESATFRGVAASSDVYTKLGLSEETNIIIHFHKKRAVSPESGQKINPISPKGISGGGIFLWPYGHELSNDWSLPKLIGIFHTYKKSEGLMIGTNLIPVLSAIWLGEMKGFGGVI